MTISMRALAFAAVLSFIFGIVLWLLYIIGLFFKSIVCARKWDELFHAVYILFSAFLYLVFLYKVNLGNSRFLFILLILGAFCGCDFLLFPRVKHLIQRAAMGVRGIVKRWIGVVLFPLRYVLTKAWMLIRTQLARMRIWLYDRRARRQIRKTIMGEIAFVLTGFGK
jgi:hypothetical protein